jgi:hypothetical protein
MVSAADVDISAVNRRFASPHFLFSIPQTREIA